jgi:hypothetical protein
MGSAKTGKGRPNKAKGGSGSTRVEVRIDRALRRRWQERLHELEVAKRAGASAFDQLWESVAAIVDHEPPLYLAGGYASDREFIRSELGENERTARRFMRVARYASPHEENKYGVAKLDAALAYVEAKMGGPAKERLPVDFGKLRVPVERDGAKVNVDLAEATVLEITRAARKVAGPGTRRARKSPLARALENALDKQPLRGLAVSASNDRVSFRNLPIAALAAFIDALWAARKNLARLQPPAHE